MYPKLGFGAADGSSPITPSMPLARSTMDKKASSLVWSSGPAGSSADVTICSPFELKGPADTLVAGSAALSSFAIIQNQQLRNRNLLLKAQHHKKSMYQIQIEEQALSHIRNMHLEQAKTNVAEGTGEWFTCEIGLQTS
ncbi:hypothetical protein BG004_005742 [Podila humilis]|nr:hypothetical protein BG004_005742 [Podila humilis]